MTTHAIAALTAEVARLKALVDEWQLDGVKPFTIHKVDMRRTMYIQQGDVARVEFTVVEDGVEVPIGRRDFTDLPSGTYDSAVAFVFTDAFGMKQGFGGAVGMHK